MRTSDACLIGKVYTSARM